MTVNMRLRVLAGILLSFIWIGANLAFASAESAPPSVLAQSLVVATPVGLSSGPPSTQAIQRPTSVHASPAATTQPITSSTPTLIAAGIPDVPATGHPTPTQPAPDRHPLRVPTETSPPPITRASVPPRIDPIIETSVINQRYSYYDRGSHVVTLQMELGMRSVDGVYGPKTRKAHINALGGPHTLLLRNYPEFGQSLTPCSHGCIPGDGHYELPTLGELINEYFLPEDRALARRIAFCESSGQTHHVGSDVVSDALAVGWFQHLAKYWGERSSKAGWGDYHPFHGRANVAVAAWLYYSSGVHHWNPSKACWDA